MPHYWLSYLSALVGAAASIQQIMLHICPGSEPYGVLLFGLSTYVWAFIVFSCAILGMSLLLFFYKPVERIEGPRRLAGFGGIAFALALAVTVINIVVSLCYSQWNPFGC